MRVSRTRTTLNKLKQSMAISHAQALLFLFLSLFFLPAALGTAIEFINCPEWFLYKDRTGNVTKVEIIPYPIKFQDKPIFKITGVTSENLTERWVHMIFRRTGRFGMLWINTYYICDVVKCPIEPGPFVLTLPNVNDPFSDHLSGEYTVQFGLDRPEFPRGTCAFFNFHANALARFTNIPRPNGVSVSKVEIYPFNVTINDNPVFRITANTPKNITSSSTVSATMVFEGGSELLPKSSRRDYELCDCTNHCPVVAGGFELAFPHPYWRHKMEAGRYRVEVQIVNQNPPFHVSMNLQFWFSVSKA